MIVDKKKRQTNADSIGLEDFYLEEKKSEIDNYDRDLDQIYIESLKPFFSHEGQRELIEKMEEGDDNARKLLIETNLKLVTPIARSFVRRTQSFSFMDLFQYGTIGLIKASYTYDKTKETSFSTYACIKILGEITRSIKKSDRMIRPSRNAYRDISHYLKTISKIQNEGQVVNYRTIAEYMNCSIEYVMTLDSICSTPVGLDYPVKGSSSISHENNTMILSDTLPDLKNDTEKDIVSLDICKEIQKNLNHSNLSKLQREIIILRNWPMQEYSQKKKNSKIMSYEEIATIYGVSHQHIAEEEKRAIHKLKLDPNFDQFANILDYPTKGLKRLELYRQEFQSNSKEKSPRISKRKVKLQNFLTFLNIDEDQYQYLYSHLTDREKNLLFLAYGNDLENPDRSEEWKCEHVIEFYCITVPIMKEILRKYANDKQKSSKEYFEKMIEVIQSTNFSPVLNVLTDEEAIVTRLSLEQFDTNQIAQFLNIEEEHVYEILQYALPLYCEHMESVQESFTKNKKMQKVC